MDKYDKNVFARNLNYYLNKSQKKQVDICSLLGVSKSTVSSWCTAKKMPRMDKIEILANHFNIMKSDLIEDRDINDLSSKKNKIMDIFDGLDSHDQDQLISYARYLISQQDSKDRK